jgi:hypothetical protein
MFTRHLLVGISTLALAAGAASAQNSINSTGVGNAAACNNVGTTGNVCTITQAGNNNNANATQSTNNNRTVIRQTGNTNIVAHNQLGSTGNNAETNQNGNNNNGQVVQNGALNDSLTNQSGNNHFALVRQLGGVAGTAGSGNFARVTQGDGPLATDQGNSQLQQRGNSNSATISQNGANGVAFVTQGGTVDAAGAAVGTQFGNSNVASVTTAGIGEQVNITQVGAGGAGQDQVNGNSATVSMNNNALGASSYYTNNGNITQRSSGNRATAIVNDGAATTPPTNPFSSNAVNITQSNTAEASTVVSNNSAFASVSQGSQMFSTINQNGRNNFADVTLTSGIAGSDPGVPGRDGGNASTINQTSVGVGSGGSTAFVSAQAPRGVAVQGFGNDSTINQNASIAYLASTGTSQPAGTTGAGEPENINGSRGQYATLWQQGRYGTAIINQNDVAGQTLATQTYGSGASAVYGRARAGVYQAGILNATAINQTGDNYADVTQGLLGAGSRSQTSLTQTDAGDTTTAGPPDGFGNPTVIPVRAYNRQLVTQYGDDNSIDANQNTINGYQSIFQRQATSFNIVDARQGIGSSGAFNGASGSRATPRSTYLSAAPAVGAATSGLSATIEQGGNRNYARAYQDGTNLNATITQLGTNAAGFQNSVIVAQQGTGNRATAVQTANVSRSGADTPAGTSPAAGPVGGRYTGVAGPQSAEIVILQGGGSATGGNRAYAEQRGKGQYARIEQTGLRNVAGIVQEAAATNAVASIDQSGNDNSYYVVQTTAGQYIDVTQIGTNNTTVTQSGGAGGSAGFTPPPGFPSF